MNRIMTPSMRVNDILEKISFDDILKLADYVTDSSRMASITAARDEIAVSRASGRDVLRIVHTDSYTYAVKVLYFFGTENELLQKLGVAEVMLT